MSERKAAAGAVASPSILASRIAGVGTSQSVSRGGASVSAAAGGLVEGAVVSDSERRPGPAALTRQRSVSAAVARPLGGVGAQKHSVRGVGSVSHLAWEGGGGADGDESGTSDEEASASTGNKGRFQSGPGGYSSGGGEVGARIGSDHASSSQAGGRTSAYGVGTTSRGVGSRSRMKTDEAATSSGGMAGGMAWFKFWSGGTGAPQEPQEGVSGHYGSLSGGH